MPEGLAILLIRALDVASFIIIARVVMSWFVRDTRHPIVQLVIRVTDPVLAPLSRHLTFGGLDLAPIVVLVVLSALRQFVATSMLGG